jgi:outer membrane usher protein
VTPVRKSGAFLDYDLRTQGAAAQPLFGSGVFDLGANAGRGVLETSFLGGMGSESGGLRRVSTSWQEDDIARRVSLRLGDAGKSGGALVSGEPFFGLQLLSNFSVAPGMTLTSRPSFAGAADRPGEADVYVDGRLVVREDLPIGPFQIDDIPAAGDVGTMQVIVKDASGREQVLSAPYFGSPSLLRPGITQFALGAGVATTQNATGAPEYEHAVFEGFDQHGFTSRFTGELDAQYLRGASALSGGGLWLLPRVGTFDLALSAGSGSQAGGVRFDYEYLGRGLRFGYEMSSLQQNLQNAGILVTSGVEAPPTLTRTSQVHMSFPLSSTSSLAFSVSNQNAGPASAVRLLNASFGRSFGRSQLNLSFFRTGGTLTSTAVTLNLLVPLDGRRRVSQTLSTQSGAAPAESVTLSADPQLDAAHDTLGYTLTLGNGDDAAQFAYANTEVDANLGFSRAAGQDAAQFEARGSVAEIDHRLFLSRDIAQSYGMAEVPGYPHVHVYANSQFAGVTDARGAVLLPNLQAYQKNVITVEGKDSPVTANVEAFSRTAVPYYRSPVTVRFPVRGNGGALVHVKMSDGTYLPAGATLHGSDHAWIVADQGEAYLDGVEPGPLRLKAEADDLRCEVSLLIPKDVANIPDLGDAVCR